MRAHWRKSSIERSNVAGHAGRAGLPRRRVALSRVVGALSAVLLVVACAGVPLPQTARSGAQQPLSTMASAEIGDFDPASFVLQLEPVVSNLDRPVSVTHAGDGSGRLFVLEKVGRVRIVQGGVLLPTPFLDIAPLVRSAGSEQGLLGIAFHPRYMENGYFFVNYPNENGDTVVARYQASWDPNVADPGTGEVVLFQQQPFANHNGGHLTFGPDGFLYIGLGDGGSANDPRGNAQDGGTWLGKMLRLDIDSALPYAIPQDNPFVGVEGMLPEIWALGLRNPWRYSFDRLAGELWIGDVGQNAWEEIDLVQPALGGGHNFGWRMYEGAHCILGPCNVDGLTMPVAEYGREAGNCAVTGGYAYRGNAHPETRGAYYFGDYCSGRIWALSLNLDGSWSMNLMATPRMQISSFGEDESGELYLTALGDGSLYRLVASAP